MVFGVFFHSSFEAHKTFTGLGNGNVVFPFDTMSILFDLDIEEYDFVPPGNI